jgi:alpha-glucosidase
MTHLSVTGNVTATPTGITGALTGGHVLRADLLEDWLIRVAITPDVGLRVDRTWMIAPDGEVPWGGRNRLSVEGFACPGGIEGCSLRLRLEPVPLRLIVEARGQDGWAEVLADRPGGAYQRFRKRGIFRHLQARDLTTRHFGLGDKSGPLDRTGRRLRCLQTDALGYNAETQDPLYKHAPFVIVQTGEQTVGILYDTLAEAAFDLGAEHSHYFPHYRHVDVAEDGLVYYVVAGPRVRDVVPRLMALTGRAHFPPRWSMGFSFTTMHHADDPNAQAVITDFAETARARAIPISAIHSGSGYTTRVDGRRYVFTWNESKFPDRDGFFARLSELGFHTCANVKPVLLCEHPAYPRAEAEGWFVRRADGEPAVEMFWGGWGASLDLTNPATVEWWKQGITEQVLGAGFTAAWNDNNEAELWDEEATVHGWGAALPAIDMRPLQALLMTRATFEATAAVAPDARPYTISRAGPIGIARYGETWTGDNHTSWHTLKWNIRQGLSMSLSGMPLVGHDIGGFAGPKPDAELLIRWVQMMSVHPRAVMNSWKPQLEHPVNLPWMHDEATEHVRTALRLRYRLLPLIYHLAHGAHVMGAPVIAPLFYHYDDTECLRDSDAFLLGPDVLVAPVVASGVAEVQVWLPRTAHGWRELHTDVHHLGGQVATIPAPLDRLALLVREGAILPLADEWDARAPHDATRLALTLFAPAGTGMAQAALFHDDGHSWTFRTDEECVLECRANWDANGITMSLTGPRTRHGSQIVLDCRDRAGRDHRLT